MCSLDQSFSWKVLFFLLLFAGQQSNNLFFSLPHHHHHHHCSLQQNFLNIKSTYIILWALQWWRQQLLLLYSSIHKNSLWKLPKWFFLSPFFLHIKIPSAQTDPPQQQLIIFHFFYTHSQGKEKKKKKKTKKLSSGDHHHGCMQRAWKEEEENVVQFDYIKVWDDAEARSTSSFLLLKMQLCVVKVLWSRVE